ncbi:MAG: endonuclease/exonuclease/phosphatase family protein [Clostridia bacterium]|nr:endonuclease/exonuclease/phosphatase family protein [Clostridia bacterium]
MKKILTLILSALMIMSCFAAVPVGAAETKAVADYTSTSDNVLYETNFINKYQTADLGVTPIDHRWTANTTPWYNKQINALSEDGFIAAATFAHISGFTINTDDFINLANYSDYTIELDMQADIITPNINGGYNSYLYYGWGTDPTSSQDMSLGNYFNYFRIPSTPRFHLNNASMSTDNRSALYTQMKTNNLNGVDSTFSFKVTSNYCSQVTVKSGTATQVFTMDSGKSFHNTTSGRFSIFVQTGDVYAHPFMKISEIRVLNSSGSVIKSVNFKSLYRTTDLGATPIDCQWSKGSDWANAQFNLNTPDGFVAASAYRHVSGISLLNSDFDLTKRQDYTISVDMQADMVIPTTAEDTARNTEFLYFGFNAPTSTDSYVNGGKDIVSNPLGWSNFKVIKNSGGNYELQANNFSVTSGNIASLYSELVRNSLNGVYSTFEFRVINGMLKEVVVDTGTHRVVYTATKDISATAGNFGIAGKTSNSGKKWGNPTITVKSIKVLDNNIKMVGHQRSLANGSTYGLRFISVVDDISQYSAIGYDVKAVIGGSTTKNFTNATKYVYNSIKGYTNESAKNYAPADFNGNYFYCDTLFNIPSGTDVEFTVTPFAINKSGVKVTFDSYTFEAERTVKMAIYNIKSGTLTGGNSANNQTTGTDPYDYSYIAADIEASGAEIVGLVEVDKNTTRNNRQDTAKVIANKLGYYYAFVAAESNKFDGEYGNAIISKYPIVSTEKISLPRASGDIEYRCALHAVVNVDGTYLDVFVTHCEQNSLTSQLTELNKYTKKCEEFVVLGDFNSHQWSESGSVFDAIENSDTVNGLGRFVGTTIPAGNAFDNIIVSNSIGFTKGTTYDGGNSDHKMFLSDLSINY